MDLRRELFISGQQPLYGCRGTYLGVFFQAVINEVNDSIGGAAGNPHFLMSQAFNYGVIQGKRSERARRKGEAFDVSELPYETDKKELLKIVEQLRRMSIEELQHVHTYALKAVQPGTWMEDYLNDLVSKIIRDKEEALNHPGSETENAG